MNSVTVYFKKNLEIHCFKGQCQNMANSYRNAAFTPSIWTDSPEETVQIQGLHFSKTCLKQPLNKKTKIGFQDR